MTPSIVWLTVLNSARNVAKHTNHYILRVQDKYMVFTTKNVSGAQCIEVSKETIIPDKKGPQYIAQKIHTIDPVTHFIKLNEKGAEYLSKYSTKLQPHVDKLQQVIEKIT